MNKKISVLIPDGEDDRALIVVRSLAYSKNVRIYVISSEYKSVHLSVHSHFIKINTNSDVERLNRIFEVSKKKDIKILLPIGQKGIQFIHSNYPLLKDNFKIPPIPGRNEFDIARNKWSLNEFCRNNKLSYLKSFLVKNHRYNKSDFNEFEGSVLLKPALGEGGLGIVFFRDVSDLVENLNKKADFYANNGYIVQEYIDGEVISFSALCENGEMLAYTIHHPAQNNNRSFVFAKIFEFIENDKAFEFSRDLLMKLRWNGMANMDLIMNSEGVLYILDFNPRYYGTLLGATVSGVNYPYLACLKSLEKPISPQSYRKIIFGIYNGKEMLTWLSGRKQEGSIPFKYTNLNFIWKDPLPALMLNFKKLS
jgi:predicted ATP-grasp superfamily ATP-dependent carboligase